MIKQNAPSEKKTFGQIQIGTSSLILIFTVLCLVVFSTLSISSAKVQQKLSEKNEQYIVDFYIGDGKAEEVLKEINVELINLENSSDGEENFQLFLKSEFGIVYQLGSNVIAYTVDLNKEQFLEVEIEILEHKEKQENNKRYTIKKWIVKNKIDYEIYDDLPVWDGNVIE